MYSKYVTSCHAFKGSILTSQWGDVKPIIPFNHHHLGDSSLSLRVVFALE